jgi:hypothetical protein
LVGLKSGTESRAEKRRKAPAEPLARGCAYYLATIHQLIKRHVEVLALSGDNTADRQLEIDFELPTDPASFLGRPDEDGRYHFLFPLAYVRKADARTGFKVRDEHGMKLTVPIRSECDQISARAAAAAGVALQAKLADSSVTLSVDDLEQIFKPIVAETPFEASLNLQEIFVRIGLEAEDGHTPTQEQREIGDAWRRAGLADVLHMLVEHSLLWVPLHGRPGERRTVTLSQQITIERRSFVRWIFCDLASLEPSRLQRLLARLSTSPASVLQLGDKQYGLRARRISFSAMAERIGQPIAWTPTEFEFPTIYVKRCQSYHFELRCPPARTPRDLRPASGTPLAEPGKELPSGRTTLTSNVARHDLQGATPAEDLWFRVSVGVGDGAFPALWFLSGAITAIVLWLLADNNPELTDTPAQIVAGILLVVPALVAALVIGGDGVPITRLIGGARLLFLITGLSAVAAAAVVAGFKPFSLKRDWTWTVCAIAATLATVPLGTSWLLSSPLAWSQLKKLKSWPLQLSALFVCVLLAAIGMVGLILVDSQSTAEAVISSTIAVYLLVLTIGIMALANNRVAMPIGKSRGTVVFSCLVAGLACAILACVELRAAIDPGPGPEGIVEYAALVIILLSLVAGFVKTWIFGWTAAKANEIHVSPQVGKALLAGETINELTVLRNREREAEDMSRSGR